MDLPRKPRKPCKPDKPDKHYDPSDADRFGVLISHQLQPFSLGCQRFFNALAPGVVALLRYFTLANINHNDKNRFCFQPSDAALLTLVSLDNKLWNPSNVVLLVVPD